ncbi:MAG: PBP1A family penicillin-binding protein [Elusimicrobia bacterium]|nr:PBP1A family penicillin-binding protein [Elusimicrobiota bacterium]
MRRKYWITAGAAALAVFALALAGLFLYAGHIISGFAPGGLGKSFSTKIYAAPFRLGEGDYTPPSALVRRLERLGYQAAEEPQKPGEYAWDPPRLTLCLRGFDSPTAAQAPETAELRYGGTGWEFTAGGAGEIRLEPELAAELSGPEKVRREPAEEADIPDQLRAAVITVEDKRFMSHHGLDFRALAGALWRNLTRKGLWGGSTITQQLAKNYFLTPRRTLRRKLAEAALALYLERRYDKRRLLTLYLNEIYWGQDGRYGVAGARAAADFYFGKAPAELDLPECALLAGLIRSPYRYNPRRDPAAALARRNYALSRMLAEGLIAAPEYAAAAAAPLRLAPLKRRGSGSADYFIAEVVRRLLKSYDENEVFRYGLTVYTTLDTELQAAAMAAVATARHQAALAALDPASGAVLALAGGKDFDSSQFDRATQASRQPGSAFKPFVYGAALEEGFTPATLLADTTRAYTGAGGRPWKPRNYDGVYHGTVTLRAALALSLNSATLHLAERVGPAKIAAFARRLGIRGPLDDSLALALGVSGTGLLELTAAYAPFCNGGFRVEPGLITAVTSSEGRVLSYGARERSPVITPAQAYLVTSLLEGVVKEGTARSLETAYGWRWPAAGKTGTTTGGRDAWFIGYTPRLLAGVWTGEDANRAIGAVGAAVALPVWAAFMKPALVGSPPLEFASPEEGLTRATVDPASGLLAVAGCPERRKEFFLAGTEPRQKCPLHSRGLKGWLKRLFGVR